MGEVLDSSAPGARGLPEDGDGTGTERNLRFQAFRSSFPRSVPHVGGASHADNSEAEHELPGLYLCWGASDGDTAFLGNR